MFNNRRKTHSIVIPDAPDLIEKARLYGGTVVDRKLPQETADLSSLNVDTIIIVFAKAALLTSFIKKTTRDVRSTLDDARKISRHYKYWTGQNRAPTTQHPADKTAMRKTSAAERHLAVLRAQKHLAAVYLTIPKPADAKKLADEKPDAIKGRPKRAKAKQPAEDKADVPKGRPKRNTAEQPAEAKTETPSGRPNKGRPRRKTGPVGS